MIMGTHSALLILNGKKASQPKIREAIYQLREEGHQIHVRVTWEGSDVTRFVEEALNLKVGTIIAGGGDGTINAVVSALMRVKKNQRPVLGILPLGTANDFASACAIPKSYNKALRLALMGTAYAIDLVQVNQNHVFINMATGGFGTRITTETPEAMKAVLGGFSYFLHGLSNFNTIKPDECHIKGASFDWKGSALVIAIGNGKQAGGGQLLCPTAHINDGLLQLRILEANELKASLLTGLLKGEENPDITGASMTALDISAPNPMTLNLDGEPIEDVAFHLEVLPGEMMCRLPEQCPLLI